MSIATCLGYPRIGVARELKKALESYWSSKTSAAELEATASALRRRHWLAMRDAGIQHIPVGDFALYDHVLDWAVTLGAIPNRYQRVADPLQRYFAMARGLQDPAQGIDIPALEMTKWFDTNYHYIVPELSETQSFKLDASTLLSQIREARALGIEPRPVVLGPVTFLLLSKMAPEAAATASPLDLLDALLPAYEQLFRLLASERIEWLQLDEPCLVLDLGARAKSAYRGALQRLTRAAARPKLLLTTYFGALGENLSLLADSRIDGLHVDLVRAPEQLEAVIATLDDPATLSLGVVDGRNVWRTDLDAAEAIVRHAVRALGQERVWVGPSCSLLHVPVDLSVERKLDPELCTWMAFAVQKLQEVRALSCSVDSAVRDPSFAEARAALDAKQRSPRITNPVVRARCATVSETMLRRAQSFAERSASQRQRLRLPAFPTTTIGSFPQTLDVRSARAGFRSGRLNALEYQQFLREETRRCVERQEAIGLDMLVHGEFERTDMVEYFGEQLEGYAFSENGWVQSYGSRCVKPPILFGDVSRPQPITVGWATYAQSLTRKPMKGMLTGPVTILQWSFVRNDQPRRETCAQIALALRDEVSDLEAAGIPAIQVDEPAIREGLPLRRSDWPEYLEWAVDCFRLATCSVRPDTQIHTHMCYAEFGDILDAVAALDADVISVETSRSKMELLTDFADFHYPNDIGPGVYDIHSPRVPTVEEMVALLERAAEVVPPERLWVNPDCGLKTRNWLEVEGALLSLVQAARQVRRQFAGKGA